jgi:hypothetical protein
MEAHDVQPVTDGYAQMIFLKKINKNKNRP